MDITPAVSARYADYLQTSAWREKRNRALRLASYRCVRCHGKRSLEVHHRTYDRLGDELDSDLEVLCGQCHADHHIEEATQTSQGVYLKLAGEALKAQPLSLVADLSDDVKTRCAKLRIPYDAHAVDRALHLLIASNRLKAPMAADSCVHPELSESPDMSHEEAVALLRRLNTGARFDVPLHPMPEVRLRTFRQTERLRAAKLVAAAIADSIATCEDLEREAGLK